MILFILLVLFIIFVLKLFVAVLTQGLVIDAHFVLVELTAAVGAGAQLFKDERPIFVIGIPNPRLVQESRDHGVNDGAEVIEQVGVIVFGGAPLDAVEDITAFGDVIVEPIGRPRNVVGPSFKMMGVVKDIAIVEPPVEDYAEGGGSLSSLVLSVTVFGGVGEKVGKIFGEVFPFVDGGGLGLHLRYPVVGGVALYKQV